MTAMTSNLLPRRAFTAARAAAAAATVTGRNGSSLAPAATTSRTHQRGLLLLTSPHQAIGDGMKHGRGPVRTKSGATLDGHTITPADADKDADKDANEGANGRATARAHHRHRP